MNTVRCAHNATLLPSGKVLIAGGIADVSNPLSSAELYDPTTGTWTITGSLNGGRWANTATLLSNGKVLVVGGYDGNSDIPSAELYDPANDKWTDTGTLNTARDNHTATLLPNGRVLVTGGYGNDNDYLASTELYDVGLGYTNSWQPQIATITSPLNLDGNLVITGSQFRGISGGSSGNSQDSSTDYPLVQLRRLDNEQTAFLLTTNWSTNSFTSLPVWNFPAGYALATVFVNGIQSTSSVVNISVPVPTTATLTGPQKLTNGFRFVFTNSVGALFGMLTTTNLALPLSQWKAIGGVVEISPGQFQFTDPQATNGGRRFYRAFVP
jgi:WD40 repeat protein